MPKISRRLKLHSKPKKKTQILNSCSVNVDHSEQNSVEDLIRGVLATVSLTTIIEKFNIRISRRDINTLERLNWLNDDIVDFYLKMLSEEFSDVYSFSSFFFTSK